MPTKRKAPEAPRDGEDPSRTKDELLAENGSKDTAGQPTPTTTEVLTPAEHFAGHLRETAVPLFLQATLRSALPQVDLVAFKLYRDQFLADCGNPTDPIEIILIEQIVMAHLITGHLQVKGAHESSAECAGVYLGAAARLTGELRRTALALQVFRATARQLKNAAGTEPVIPAELVQEVESDAPKNGAGTEKETVSGSTDQDGPLVLPLRRSATS